VNFRIYIFEVNSKVARLGSKSNLVILKSYQHDLSRKSRKQQSLTNITITNFIKLYVAPTMLPLFYSLDQQVCKAGKTSEDIYLCVLHYIEAE